MRLRDHRDAAVEVDDDARFGLIVAYGMARARLERWLVRVLEWFAAERSAGRVPTRSALRRRVELETALSAIESEVALFSAGAASTAAIAMPRAARIGAESAERLVQRIAVDTGLFVPPIEAARVLDASMADGAPLTELFERIAPDTVGAARNTLVEGMVAGLNPRVIGAELDDVLQVPLWRAQTIARTEILRSFRAASIATYRAHDDSVSGWEWLSALDSRTCVVCWAMHGSVHPVTEPFASHPNCRCVPVPIVNGQRLLRPGAEEFAKLPESRQRETLGPKAFEMYRDGRLTLSQLVRYGRNEYGPYLARRSLSDIQARRAA